MSSVAGSLISVMGNGFAGGAYPIATMDYGPQPKPTAPVKPQDPVERNATEWNIYGQAGSFPGFDTAPPGSPLIYWQMRRYSAIRLAYACVMSPILAGTQVIELVNPAEAEAEKSGVDPKEITDATSNRGKQTDLAQKMIDAANIEVLPFIAACMLPGSEALHFGWWLQELGWARNGRTAGARTIPDYARPIQPGEAVVYRDIYKQFTGYKINSEYRDARYAIHTVNNPHINMIWGEARNEWVREEWWRVRQSELNADRSERKASGIQMAIGGPPGQRFTDENGKPVSTSQFMGGIMNAAVQGESFTYPTWVSDEETMLEHPELWGKPIWEIKQLDWGNVGPAIQAHMERVGQQNTAIMRGWMRPEREAMQGKHGTNAESETQGAIGTLDSEFVANQFLVQLSAQVLDRWRITNYGPDSPKLRCKQSPLSDPSQEFRQKLYVQMCSGPTPNEKATAQIDERKLAESLEIPILSEEDTDAAIQKQQQEKQDQQQQQHEQQLATIAAKGAGNNGDGDQPKMNGNGNGRMKLSADVAERLAPFLLDEIPERLALAAEELTGGHWVTIEGEHVYLKGGTIAAGPAKLEGKKVSDLPARSKPMSSADHDKAESEHRAAAVAANERGDHKTANKHVKVAAEHEGHAAALREKNGDESRHDEEFEKLRDAWQNQASKKSTKSLKESLRSSYGKPNGHPDHLHPLARETITSELEKRGVKINHAPTEEPAAPSGDADGEDHSGMSAPNEMADLSHRPTYHSGPSASGKAPTDSDVQSAIAAKTDPSSGLAKIHDVRSHIAEKHGAQFAGDSLDKQMKSMRGDKIDMYGTHDPISMTPDELRARVKGAGDDFVVARNRKK